MLHQGLVCTRARREPPDQPPRQIGGEERGRGEGKSIWIKLRVQAVWPRALPQPAGKSDKHPELNQRAQSERFFPLRGYGAQGLEEASLCRGRDEVLWLDTEASAQHLSLTCYVLHLPRESTDKMLPARVWGDACFHVFCNPQATDTKS